MNTENGGDSSPYKNLIELEFNQGAKLYSDANTDWGAMGMITSEKFLGFLKPLRHYEERFRMLRSPADADLIMQRSDPQSVAAYDQLVDEFNADLERIKIEKDFATIKDFAMKGRKLVFPKE